MSPDPLMVVWVLSVVAVVFFLCLWFSNRKRARVLQQIESACEKELPKSREEVHQAFLEILHRKVPISGTREEVHQKFIAKIEEIVGLSLREMQEMPLDELHARTEAMLGRPMRIVSRWPLIGRGHSARVARQGLPPTREEWNRRTDRTFRPSLAERFSVFWSRLFGNASH